MTDKIDKEAVCVGVRLRPFVPYEYGQKQCLTIRDNVVSVDSSAVEQAQRAKDFTFDCAMDSTDPKSKNYVSQDKCYQLMAKRMVDHVIQGYYTCLFCYGQTGTGKTTTIMGKVQPVEEQGLLLRLMHDLFDEMAAQQQQGSEVHCKVQMLEVYNEKIHDLLCTPSKDRGGGKAKAEVHVHPKLGVYVKNVVDEPVESFDKCLQLIEYGNTMKTVAATAMNAKSSRAHTIFKLMVEKRGGCDNTIVTSEAFFVDLAGRENEKTNKVSGERLVELTFINRSLMWLASCIQALAKPEGPRKSMAASAVNDGMMSRFRNSKLTLLLSNALSGNSKTSMIGTLSPALANFEESFSTLNFAATVKSIKIKAAPATAVDKDALVHCLQLELQQLREQLAAAQEKGVSDAILQKLDATQCLVEKYRKDWAQAQDESKRLMAQRGAAMEKMGVMTRWSLSKSRSTSLTSPFPHLANYSEDPYLCGRLAFHPAEVGREYCLGYDIASCDFGVPRGLGILPRTCFIRRDSNGRLFLRAAGYADLPDSGYSSSGTCSSEEEWCPSSPALSSRSDIASIEVNGKQLKDTSYVQLNHLDRVVLGRSVLLYAFTQPGSSIDELPPEKMPAASRASQRKADGALLVEILGKKRAAQPEQLQMAKRIMSQLQSQNLDSDGITNVHEFLLMAKKAAGMVEEANHITDDVKPGGQTGLKFELCGVAPVFATGYGRTCCPDLSVRLVRRISPEQAKAKASAANARRMSRQASATRTSMLLQHFADSGNSGEEESQVEVLFIWNFEKFSSRLQLMQEIWHARAEDPRKFKLDNFANPWSESGPGEIAELRRQYNELRDSIVSQGSGLSSEKENISGDLQDLSSLSPAELSVSARRAHAQLLELQNKYNSMNAENKRLRVRISELNMQLQRHLNGGPTSTGDSPVSPRMEGGVSNESSPLGKEPCPPTLRGILDLSKTNLLLVLDLFDTLSRLSSTMLHASAACLQTPGVDASDPSLSAARKRLADAAADLAEFFAQSTPGIGPGVPCQADKRQNLQTHVWVAPPRSTAGRLPPSQLLLRPPPATSTVPQVRSHPEPVTGAVQRHASWQPPSQASVQSALRPAPVQHTTVSLPLYAVQSL
eukprot:TRINITY_DN48042_c0_g1_i1.p1 TRINITY_DN48042_c0_g1~~TRINITY_DN48042_c0_g1_i1.p1  ORF type:complete len:1119 (+),score=211.71 TRINITY_DN48042_c0_g1_i1:151-3507(+)